TGEKVILVAASAYAQDVYENFKASRGESISDEKMLKITRYSTMFVVIAALVLALMKPDFVLALCMFAWSAMASTVLIPLVFGLFWKKGTAKAAWISGIAALVTAVLWWLLFKYPGAADVFAPLRVTLFTDPFPFSLGSIHEFIMSQVVALIVFPIVSLKTTPPETEFVDKIFDEFKLIRKAKA
ncbi:MAG: sodium:solute symporter family transporter, partial [Promethearchaeota archaeon]